MPVARLLLPMLLAAGMAFGGSPGFAQSGPVGIGFAQAEEGIWYCRGGDPVQALNCAREKCRAEGSGQSCARTAWCYPARWTGVMVVWFDDFHATVPLCGAPSATALRAALKAVCAGSEGATSCSPLFVIDPDGKEHSLEAAAEEWHPDAGASEDGWPVDLGQ
jgi:hypothetical protein